MTTKTLLIQSSARHEGSVTRTLAEELTGKFGGPVTRRDVAGGLPFVDTSWLAARDAGEAGGALAMSDALIEELRAHDRIVFAVPVYNFSIPAALKAWIDQVARPGKTFRYTADGPVGLLEGKTAYIVVASGGTPVDGPWDYATPYLRHVLSVMGISDVEVIAADALGNDADKTLDAARCRIEDLAGLPRAA